jgi:hypothetical protein
LRGPGGEWQGSTIVASPGEEITLQVDAGSGTEELTSVDIVSDNGVSPYPYYYSDNVKCDSSGCNPNDFVKSQLTPSYIEQHRRYVASNGHATRKARIDQPPPGTVVTTVPLEGYRDTEAITIHVPDTPSSRPDGKHFFYAIVHAGEPRAWTGPILTSAAAPIAEPGGLMTPFDPPRTLTDEAIEAKLERFIERAKRPFVFGCAIGGRLRVASSKARHRDVRLSSR